MKHRTAAPSSSRHWLVAIAFAVACLFIWEPNAQAALRRYPIDQQEVDKMRVESPEAEALLEQGEALGAAGKVEEADALFQKGLELYKLGSVLQRRHCEALTMLGRRSQATTACYRALEGSRSNSNVRATVRAWVSGPEVPTMSDLGMALDLASKAMSRAPGQFTPIAALCDIGASLGDGIMLQHCATELTRIAPEAPETKRALALLSSLCPPARFWAGWIAIGALLWATTAHALWRWIRRSARRTGANAAFAGGALAIALSAMTVPAAASGATEPPRAQLSTKWSINDDDPESSIPPEKDRNKDPLEFGYWLQDVIFRAEVHSKHGHHDVAARLYKALIKAMPDRSIAYTKLCDEYEALGDREKAVAACGEALLHEGLLVKDYEHFVHLVLGTPGSLPEQQVKALANVLAHMKEDPAGREVVDELDCEVGVRTSNVAELEACTANLAKTDPNGPKTIAFQWSLAMLRSKFDQAKALLEQGKASGVSAEALAGMQRAMDDAESAKRRYRLVFMGIAAALVLAAAGVLVGASLRRRAATRATA